MISHGAGGDVNGHHDTAEALADHGFIVAAINHPGDTARDHSAIGSLPALLINRPSDIKRLIDFMLSDWQNASRIDPHRIGFFGFSRGALTGLVLAGGQPDMGKMAIECRAEPDWGVCQHPTLPPQPLPRDPRIRAMVLADPVFGAMFVDGLSTVTLPLQLWASEYGGGGVTPADAKAVDEGLPTKPSYTIVPNATHYAFLAPCSPALAQAVPQICTDRTGFDRKQFHETFDASVVTFFERTLGK
ncbi:hypothetical protein LFL96_01220 [Paraburkholderia sp. D15]|uniref:alpha/beta hydrolase family protein n=1 Tax=Paraburkholderia sp. D15 TaxID=2880218 RepID=UPI00247B0976|nr:hypothetical protein [Paraburkholderia sp. D15]WGS50158.1 hypothetical protein LFL96_01220 [Paraburkholderia sp. D15]